MSESLFSNKMNKSSRNQLFLHSAKPRGFIRVVRATGTRSQVDANFNHDIKIYSEYRHIATSPGDEGAEFFTKKFKPPANYFDQSVLPVCFISLEYRGKAISKINPIINPGSWGTDRIITLRAQSNGTTFEEGMDYFANIFMISMADGQSVLADPAYSFMPVEWGDDDQELRISSMALNQMQENTDYLYRNRVEGSLRNVDYKTKDPDSYVKYLNDNLVMYAKYLEFNPLNDKFDKNDSTDESNPKKFVVEFEFPRHLFNTDAHPVVIANVGAKVATGSTIRQLSSILKEVRAKSFDLEIREHSTTTDFAIDQTYFVSFVAIGERFPTT